MMKLKSILLILLTLVCSVQAAQLMLSPSDKCGILMSIDGSWSNLPPSDISLSYNEKGIIISARLLKPAGENFILKGAGEDDLALFAGDVFEVQIAPGVDGDEYYHLAIGPSAAMYTAKKRDLGWNPTGIIRQCRISGNVWQVTLFIEYAAIGCDLPKKGEQWRINLCRTNIDAQGRMECASFSGATNFHDVKQYALVTFGRVDAPEVPLLRQVINGETFVKFIFERIASPEELVAECTTGESTASLPLIGENGFYSVTMPLDGYIPPKGSRQFSISLKNKNTGSTEFSQTAYLPVVRHTDLLVPDRFYYLAGDKEMKIRQFLGNNAILSLRNDVACIARIINPKREECIPLTGIAPGRYIIELRQGKIYTTRVIFILPEKPQLFTAAPRSRLKIVDNRYLTLNDVPTFFWGVSASDKYFFQFDPATNLLCVPNGGQENGVRCISMPPKGEIHRNPENSWAFPDPQSSMRIAREYAASLDPALPALHRICYEAALPLLTIHPDGSRSVTDSQSYFTQLYAQLKRTNPAAFYTIHIDNPSRIKDYVVACDIFEYASFSSSYAINMMNRLPLDIAHLTGSVTNKPLIFWLGGTIPNEYCRSAEELRCAAYYCILHGISGNIIHLGHGFLPAERSRVWSLISGILAEIQSFYPDFVAGEDITAEVHNESAGEIRYKAVRTTSGKVMILAVNTSPVELTCRFTLNGKRYVQQLTPLEPFVFK